MINDRDTVAMGSHAPTKPNHIPTGAGGGHKSEAPGAVPPAPRAESPNKTSVILSRTAAVFRAIALSPVYQTLIAGAATVGIVLLGGQR